MYIRTDDDHNIVEVIFVGIKPEKNGFEIDDNIDNDILKNILKYKYIDGEFIKNNITDMKQEKINEIKNIKISVMNSICQNCIINGIDYNGSHYSLTEHDQINLMRHSFSAMVNPTGTFLYHADGEECREYSSAEIIQIATLAEKWKTYHLTYFNMIKSYIKNITDVNEVINVLYGITLSEDQETKLSEILTMEDGSILSLPREIIYDNYDYEKLFPEEVDISQIKTTTESDSDINEEKEETII